MESESFLIRYQDYIDEIITDCIVYRADAGLLADSAKILHKPCKALWDTGATTTMITKNVVDALNLRPVTYATVYHAGGNSTEPCYNTYIHLPNNVLIGPIQVVEGMLEGVDVLIGMDIIGEGDFFITNNDEHTEFSFTIPSVKKL